MRRKMVIFVLKKTFLLTKWSSLACIPLRNMLCLNGLLTKIGVAIFGQILGVNGVLLILTSGHT